MKNIKEQKALSPEEANFILQLDYLMEQMSLSKLPIDEAYERLITLVFYHDQNC